MDLLIKGMEMPENCGNCPISTNTRKCTILWREFNPDKRLDDCPLKPSQHRIYDCVDDDPRAHILTALALLTLDYYNKNYLDSSICNDNRFNIEIRHLLCEALKKAENFCPTCGSDMRGSGDE